MNGFDFAEGRRGGTNPGEARFDLVLEIALSTLISAISFDADTKNSWILDILVF